MNRIFSGLIFLMSVQLFGQEKEIDNKINHIKSHLYQAKRKSINISNLNTQELNLHDSTQNIAIGKTYHWGGRFEITGIGFDIKDTNFYSTYYFRNDSLIFIEKHQSYSFKTQNSIGIMNTTKKIYVENNRLILHKVHLPNNEIKVIPFDSEIEKIILKEAYYLKNLK